MTVTRRHLRHLALLLLLAPATLAISRASTVSPDVPSPTPPNAPVVPAGARYTVQSLVSDGSVPAVTTDAELVNPWGLVFHPNGPAWIADNHTGVASVVSGEGLKQTRLVTIPAPTRGASPSAPTGIAFNGSSDFTVSEGGKTAPSLFLFATEDGTISGWSAEVDAANAILVVDKSSSGAVFKGLALAANGTGHFLYATDFHNGRVDVLDATFADAKVPGGFSDPRIPAGYAPFGIANIGGDLYVTFAEQDAARMDDVAGQGLGFVDEFDANGFLIRRVATRGQLDAPWGVALAPGDFGPFSNDLLVGNFGDGTINAYDLDSGNFQGKLRGTDSQPLVISGLWGLAFGNGVLDQPTRALFFTAGPDAESHGVYGRIDPAPMIGN